MSNKTVVSIVCDNCGRELVIESSYPANYSLQLSAIDTNTNTTGVQFAVAVVPPINETLHFCGFSCLTKWANGL